MITFNTIIKQLQSFEIPSVKLIKVCKKDGRTVHEEIGVQVYCPQELKDRWMDFVTTLFQGQGLDIRYLYEQEMIDIRMQEPIDIFEKMKIFNPQHN